MLTEASTMPNAYFGEPNILGDAQYDYWVVCPGCDEIYNRGRNGTGIHTVCENNLVKLRKSPHEKARDEWEKIRKKISPIIFMRDDYQCKKCGSTDYLTIDHIIPISRGGLHESENLQTLCRSCNSR